MPVPNINSPRYYQLFTQLQTGGYNAINNTAGVWNNAGYKQVRIDANSMSGNKNAPYSRFPVLTGTRSEVAGIRGRKASTWSIRGVPIIPSGAAGTVPDCDHFLQNMFGAPATLSAGVSAAYNFVDTGYLPLSMFYANKAFTTLLSYFYWGGGITRCKFNFNGLFMTMDLDGFAGWQLDNIGFGTFDSIALAGLTAFPAIPVGSTVNGTPIAGFGAGYTATIHSQSVELYTKVLSITLETGLEPIDNVYGSPYNINMVGAARRISLELNTYDDDSAALNALKIDCDTNFSSISASINAGTVAGSIVNFVLNNVQPNAFTTKDQGALVSFDIPTSYAHATSPGVTDDMVMTFR